jgi:hypothetical protein
VQSNKLLPDQEKNCMNILKEIFHDFGGYEYTKAIKEADNFFNNIIGSTDLRLQREWGTVSTCIIDVESKYPLGG